MVLQECFMFFFRVCRFLNDFFKFLKYLYFRKTCFSSLKTRLIFWICEWVESMKTEVEQSTEHRIQTKWNYLLCCPFTHFSTCFWKMRYFTNPFGHGHNIKSIEKFYKRKINHVFNKEHPELNWLFSIAIYTNN